MNAIKAILVMGVGLALFVAVASILAPMILAVGALMLSLLAIVIVIGVVFIIFRAVFGSKYDKKEVEAYALSLYQEEFVITNYQTVLNELKAFIKLSGEFNPKDMYWDNAIKGRLCELK